MEIGKGNCGVLNFQWLVSHTVLYIWTLMSLCHMHKNFHQRIVPSLLVIHVQFHMPLNLAYGLKPLVSFSVSHSAQNQVGAPVSFWPQTPSSPVHCRWHSECPAHPESLFLWHLCKVGLILLAAHLLSQMCKSHQSQLLPKMERININNDKTYWNCL